MPTNVEIKAVVADLPALRERVERISGIPGEEIYQEDTFFVVPQGRLKLRVFSLERGELIYYERTDARDPKPSHYLISRTSEPESLLDLLAASLGIAGHVRKHRTLYMIGNTRVHLDEVEHLGTYMELEVVLAAGESPKDGEETARKLMDELHIDPFDLVRGAYVDLINATKKAEIGGDQ
jgi:predicted adenylyl cyclase CyaB